MSTKETPKGSISWPTLAHNTHEFLLDWNDVILGYLRDGLVEYAEKFHLSALPEKHHFVMLFDMDEATFNDLYRRSD